MYLLLVWLGKIVQQVSRLFHNSGAALPGLIIERLNPKFLEKALLKLPDGVVVISGTNGKTTTTKLVADTLQAAGERVLSNKTGSNMTRGLVSTIISRTNLLGKLPFDVAVLEVDEAYSAVLARKIPIRAALVLNVMRDQLDRFGEIDKTAEYLGNLTKHAKELVVLNADDNRVAALPTNSKAVKVTFAAGRSVQDQLLSDDEWHSKGTKKGSTKAGVILSSSGHATLSLGVLGDVNTHLEGVHNHLNFAAAYALLSHLRSDIEPSNLLGLMARVKPAFGRGETISAGESKFDILLIKNPSSFMQTVKATGLKDFSSVTVMINDAYADSRDVSWLWDVDVSAFKSAKRLITAGSRGYDMAVRLKYEDSQPAEVFGDEKETISKLLKSPGNHAVFCTYTAMLALRKELVRRGHAEQVV